MIGRYFKKFINYCNNQSVLKLKGTRAIHQSNQLKGVNFQGDISVGTNNILKFVDASGKISIGNFNTLNGPNLMLLSRVHHIEIGNFCSIARDVTIQEYNHRVDRMTTYYTGKNLFGEKNAGEIYSKGPIKIGSDVWIGTKVVILSGITIGSGSVIAAGSVVTKDIPPYAIVGGNPAKVIKYRFTPDVIEQMLKLEWWNWPLEKIKRNQSLFDRPVTEVDFGKVKE